MIALLPSDDPHRVHVRPGPSWSQGFAAYGGYVAAAALKATRACGHTRPLLSAQVNFFAPALVQGFDVEVEALRVGGGTSVVEARIFSAHPKLADGNMGLVAKILLTLGEARPSSFELSQSLDPEQLKEFERLRDRTADTPVIAGVVPGFMGHFHFRPLQYGVPFAGTRSQYHAIAFKPKFDAPDDLAEFLLLINDINPPPLLTYLNQPAPASTASWMMTIEHPQPEALSADWFYVLLHLDTAGGGNGNHATMLFDAAGRHISSNRQTTAVFEQGVGAGPVTKLTTLPRRLTFRVGYSLFQAYVRVKGWMQRR